MLRSSQPERIATLCTRDVHEWVALRNGSTTRCMKTWKLTKADLESARLSKRE
ncbi:unnamed protein product [Mycena citricolor]|uniref:Uncharacterized protein n=1 Tax=Mycena citricolor TaxID=2018698 RepID=A0AAD2HBJ6_9AGAR|nr:unnamed protein product [Mycena citricolor]